MFCLRVIKRDLTAKVKVDSRVSELFKTDFFMLLNIKAKWSMGLLKRKIFSQIFQFSVISFQSEAYH